jgi:hypothetical protein
MGIDRLFCNPIGGALQSMVFGSFIEPSLQ